MWSKWHVFNPLGLFKKLIKDTLFDNLFQKNFLQGKNGQNRPENQQNLNMTKFAPKSDKFMKWKFGECLNYKGGLRILIWAPEMPFFGGKNSHIAKSAYLGFHIVYPSYKYVLSPSCCNFSILITINWIMVVSVHQCIIMLPFVPSRAKRCLSLTQVCQSPRFQPVVAPFPAYHRTISSLSHNHLEDSGF